MGSVCACGGGGGGGAAATSGVREPPHWTQASAKRARPMVLVVGRNMLGLPPGAEAKKRRARGNARASSSASERPYGSRNPARRARRRSDYPCPAWEISRGWAGRGRGSAALEQLVEGAVELVVVVDGAGRHRGRLVRLQGGDALLHVAIAGIAACDLLEIVERLFHVALHLVDVAEV